MRAIIQIYPPEVKKMAQRSSRKVGPHDQYIPHFAGLGWAELLEFWPDADNACYLVALDNRQVSVLLSLLDQVAWCWWLWNIDASDTETGATINDFVDELKGCLMSGCSVGDLITAVNGLTDVWAECCRKMAGRGTQDIDDPPHDGSVPIGVGEQFDTNEAFFSAKCRVANAIYDTLYGVVTDISESDIDVIMSGVVGGPTAILAAIMARAGVLGWAISKVSMAVISLAFLLIELVVDFDDVVAALDDKHDELVYALFNASDATNARSSFMVVLATATPSLAVPGMSLIGTLLTNDLLNQLWHPRPDIAGYVSPDPVTCTTTIQVWSFPTTGQGWTFRDDSTAGGPNSADGVHVPAKGAWEIELSSPGTGNAIRARGTIYLDSLSIAVDVGNSVQFDFSASSDEVSTTLEITVIYSDLSEFHKNTGGPGSAAGTATLDITEAGTIETIECRVSRAWQRSFVATRDIEEVRVQ